MAEENREKIKVEVKTEESEKETKSRNPWIYSTALLIVIVIAMSGIQMTGMFTAPDGATPEAQISPQDAGQKAVDFINNNLVQPGTIVALDSVTEMSGIYNVITFYMENEIPVYMTKDGRYLIVLGVPGMDVIDMDNFVKPETQEPEEPELQPSETEIPKSDKPTLDLFIFSYCPAGTAAERSIVPMGELLGDKADITVKFFSHMHGQYEKEENIRQECIQKEEPDKFWEYAKELLYSSEVGACSRNAECLAGMTEEIMETVGIDVTKINTCIEIDGESIYAAEQQEAGALGLRYSPSFVINGVYLPNLDRSPEGIKNALCSAFNTPPSECSETLSATGGTSSGGCG